LRIANYHKVAVIILNYNGWQDTIECLESVLRNDYPNYQVIVVDNGSPDNSMEYIKAWAEGRQKVLTPELIILSAIYLFYPEKIQFLMYFTLIVKQKEKENPDLEKVLKIRFLLLFIKIFLK